MSKGLSQLAIHLQNFGLSTALQAEDITRPNLVVTNPISSALVEELTLDTSRYVTAWGYELGLLGEKPAAAERLAFLLGVPNLRATSSARAHEASS